MALTHATAVACHLPCAHLQLYTDKVPATLLRSDNQGSGMRAQFEKMIRQKQDEICAAIEAVDGGRFHQDAWTRPGGGGGISRVLQGGKARAACCVLTSSLPLDRHQIVCAHSCFTLRLTCRCGRRPA